MDVDEGTEGKDASICGSEDETAQNGKVEKDEGYGAVQGEGVINGTS